VLAGRDSYSPSQPICRAPKNVDFSIMPFSAALSNYPQMLLLAFEAAYLAKTA
jgi:hypothetical protein